MGECGCGDFVGDFKFPGPGKDIYVLDVYPGCRDCDTPAGIVIYRFTPKEAGEWGCERVEKLDISSIGTGIPVLDPNILKKKMRAFAEPVKEEYDADGLVQDAVDDCFIESSRATFDEWLKEREKHRKAGK